MNTLPILAVILVVAVIALVSAVIFLALVKGKGKSSSSAYPYQRSDAFLSKAERSFYGVLVQAVGSKGLVFSKVRVADVITPKKGMNRSDWQRAFNAISAKHFDFLICDPKDCSVKAAVELDDSSHDSAKRQKRDTLLNGACVSAELPLLRFKVARAYVLADIQRQLAQTLAPFGEIEPDGAVEAPAQPRSARPSVEKAPPRATRPPKALEPPATPPSPELPSQSVDPPASSPPCPACGEPMLRRKAKSGSNAGHEFLGCSTFPKCRGVLKLNP